MEGDSQGDPPAVVEDAKTELSNRPACSSAGSVCSNSLPSASNVDVAANTGDGDTSEDKYTCKKESSKSNVQSKRERYLQELREERDSLVPQTCVYTRRLLQNEIQRIENEPHSLEDEGNPIAAHSLEGDVNHITQEPNITNSGPPRRPFDNEEHVNLREKVFFPVDQHPQYNFVGTLLGPRGSNLKSIAALTKTKISVLGKGSTRDKCREEKLSNSGDPKHEHFKEPLHVLIQVAGPRYQTQLRLASAVKEIKAYTVVPEAKAESCSEYAFESEEHVNLSEKVFIPIDKHPSYNFLGKLFGTGGSNLRNIAAFTKTRISILGKGSTKDKSKEEELSNSGDPKHEHLKEPLHVFIQVAGPKKQTETRLSEAVKEIEKYMDPENKEIKEKQFSEYTSMKYQAAHNTTSYPVKTQHYHYTPYTLDTQYPYSDSRGSGGAGLYYAP